MVRRCASPCGPARVQGSSKLRENQDSNKAEGSNCWEEQAVSCKDSSSSSSSHMSSDVMKEASSSNESKEEEKSWEKLLSEAAS
ncbi:hypothetical protein EJB05_39736, partial [Eragrostis curvula]